MMVLRIQMSLFVEGDDSRRARIRRDVTLRVTDHSQHLHLRQQIIDFSRFNDVSSQEYQHNQTRRKI